jgi:hypothetical protein
MESQAHLHRTSPLSTLSSWRASPLASLGNLPRELAAAIFSFDNTYKEKMNLCLQQIGFDQYMKKRMEELRRRHGRMRAYF